MKKVVKRKMGKEPLTAPITFSHYSGAVKTNYWHTWSIEIRRQEPFTKRITSIMV